MSVVSEHLDISDSDSSVDPKQKQRTSDGVQSLDAFPWRAGISNTFLCCAYKQQRKWARWRKYAGNRILKLVWPTNTFTSHFVECPRESILVPYSQKLQRWCRLCTRIVEWAKKWMLDQNKHCHADCINRG